MIGAGEAVRRLYLIRMEAAGDLQPNCPILDEFERLAERDRIKCRMLARHHSHAIRLRHGLIWFERREEDAAALQRGERLLLRFATLNA